MYLVSSNGSSFALTIVGYQFPHLAQEEYDSNWLNIHIDVATPEHSWSATDPCLLTYEVARLAEWLEAIDQGKPVEYEIGFTEPCLWFRLAKTKLRGIVKSLRVHFELELRPEWARSEQMRKRDLFVEFPISEIDLQQAASALRTQLSDYPQRTER
jgi:hypothetical protein